MIHIRKYLLFFTALMIVVSSLSGQDKYRAVHWGAGEGLLFENHNILLKDAGGFLWIGTSNGVMRFDGSNFVNYFAEKKNSGALRSLAVNNLIEDSLHNIWIGTSKGLYFYDRVADTIRIILPPIHVYGQFVIPFWASRDEVFCVEAGYKLTAYNILTFQKKYLPSIEEYKGYGDFEHTVFDEKSNSIWISEQANEKYTGGLFRLSVSDGKTAHFTWPCYKNIPHHDHFPADMVYDRKRNAIWISSKDGLMEFTLADQLYHHIATLPEIDSAKDFIYDNGIGLDPSDRIWWCSYPMGPVIYDPSTKSFAKPFADLKVQRRIAAANLFIYCDRDGMVWTSCSEQSRGIYQIIPASIPVVRYSPDTSKPHSLSGNFLNGMITADHNHLWIGQGDELNIFDARTGYFKLISSEKDLPVFHGRLIGPVQIDTLHQKALFDIWDQAKAISELYVMDIPTRNCRLVVFKDSAGRTIDPPTGYSVFSYQQGAILISSEFSKTGKGMFTVNTDSALARRVGPFEYTGGNLATDNDRFIFMKDVIGRTYASQNGHWIRTTTPMDSLDWTAIYYNDKDKTYWVGISGALIQYDPNFRVLKRYFLDNELVGDVINGISSDNDGNIWIRFIRTIVWLNTKTGKISSLSEKDGLIKQAYDGGPVKDGGDLYFWAINGQGIDRVMPDKVTKNYPPSRIYIKSLMINQNSFPLPTGINEIRELSLRYFQNKIAIETGVIDYYTKGASHIRYKLERVNDNWQTAPANYTIRYDGIPPGSYWLVIQASNAANEFNGPEKRLHILINPPFWQTTWFRIMLGIVLLCTFYGIYRWRTATLRRQKRVLEQTVKERTAEVVEEKAEIERQKDVIQKEKDKSDELLLNILPSEVAEELKEKGYTTAKSFDEVTILFSDIKGFTHIAENMTAQGLVKEIDTYFSAFDRIMQQYGLEKIKTIGDAYIAAGGLPEQNIATAGHVVEAAIAMQHIVGGFQKQRMANNQPYFELRIGIHTGPVVAGVVGIKKFQYDIWGDTVNLAARMEQSGLPGKINISQFTYDKVKDRFTCTHRGKIEAKNKGDIDMYFVET